VVRACAELAPDRARARGTGLSGRRQRVGAASSLGPVPMNQVLEIDPDNLVCVVQPGAVNNDGPRRPWPTWPVVPAGRPAHRVHDRGNVATNAGGRAA